MTCYKDFLVIFGGSGSYNQEIKKRETFNDIWFYDLRSDKWFEPLRQRDELTSLASKQTNI